MPFGANQPSTTIPLQDAIKKLSKYFGLYTVKDLAARIALTQIQGQAAASASTEFDLPAPPAHITKIIELLIDTSSGGYTSLDIVKGINGLMSGENAEEVTQAVNRVVKIVFGSGDESENSSPAEEAGILKGSVNGPKDAVNSILASTVINSNMAMPNREGTPSLSAIMMNSVRVLPIHKNVNAVTIFMNGLPTMELARCVPYLDIQFQFPQAPVDGANRINGMGLIKFLDGAETAADGTRRLLLNANELDGSLSDGTKQQFTVAGMEVFTAPQTMVNANEDRDQSLDGNRRSAPVRDKFRPFLTFKTLTVDVVPTTGFMCYKSAKMDFVLHDKSRVAEIADFIRPDLYSNTEILIEYGWNHPDKPAAGNAYADLINGMRCREKYGIVNVSMNFDDAGQVNISLTLAMKGSTDFRTETISSDEGGVGDIIRNIRRLSGQVADIRRRVFQHNTPGTPEVRGVQILNTAGDANGQILLSPQLRTALTQFQRQLNSSHTPATNDLSATLRELYGANGQGGTASRLRTTIQQKIAGKLAKVSRSGTDPFATNATTQVNGRSNGRRYVTYDATSNRAIQEADRVLSAAQVSTSVTLGKLLLLFVGQPLAMSHRFDDIQLIFYPFNMYAGKANSLNIANFLVDTRYFLDQYTRYRTESIARAADMSLQDFLVFIARTIIEDPAAPSYGLRSPGGDGRQFWRTVSSGEGGGTSTRADADGGNTAEINELALQRRMETLLQGTTPDGSFRLPQIDYYIECVPRSAAAIGEGQDNTGASALTILRVHIFDKHTTSYDSQGAILEASRNDELRTVGSLPERTGGNVGVRQSQNEAANSILESANNAGLITQIPNSNPKLYRINGGSQRIREFMMKTSPYIIIGSQGTAVKTAGLATIQDPALSTVNLLRSFHADPMEPNGESPGGLPLQVIPCELSINCYGCPLIEYMTKFFVDFGTGTTIDNYYNVIGISHKFEQGSFTTDVKFAPYDGWGRYRSLIDTIQSAQTVLDDIQKNAGTAEPT